MGGLGEQLELVGKGAGPCVSVIVPVWNAAGYVARTLESLIAQTFGDWECILVDDGSTDNSVALLEEFVQKDGRFQLICQMNAGAAAARNRGLEEVRGGWVYFLDSDDVMHPQLLELAVGTARVHGADLVCFRVMVTPEGAPEPELVAVDAGAVGLTVCAEPAALGVGVVTTAPWDKLYQRNLLEGERFIPGIAYEDAPFVYSLLAKSPRTVLLDCVLYFVRERRGSWGRRCPDLSRLEGHIEGVKRVVRRFREMGRDRELAIFARSFVPTSIKEQLGLCRHADAKDRPAMRSAFVAELRWLDSLGLLNRRGHRLRRYWLCRLMMRFL